MGFWETAAKVGKGAAKVGMSVAKGMAERVEKDVELYRTERDYASDKSDDVLLYWKDRTSGTKRRAIVDELKSRGYDL